MKLRTVVVFNPRICMKEDNPGFEKIIKGDNLRDIIILTL